MKEFYEDYWQHRQKQGYIYSEKSFPFRFSIILSIVGDSKNILDVGCGEGFLSSLLMKQGNRVVGIDVSEQAVELAKQNGIDAHVCDIEERNPPFEDKSFDVIVLSEVLEHIVRPRKVLERLKRYVKKDGYFVITFPNIAFYKYRLNLLSGRFPKQHVYDESEHLHYWAIPNFIDFLSSCNFKAMKVIPVYSFPFCEYVMKSRLQLPKILLNVFANSLGYQIVVVASPNKS